MVAQVSADPVETETWLGVDSPHDTPSGGVGYELLWCPGLMNHGALITSHVRRGHGLICTSLPGGEMAWPVPASEEGRWPDLYQPRRKEMAWPVPASEERAWPDLYQPPRRGRGLTCTSLWGGGVAWPVPAPEEGAWPDLYQPPRKGHGLTCTSLRGGSVAWPVHASEEGAWPDLYPLPRRGRGLTCTRLRGMGLA